MKYTKYNITEMSEKKFKLIDNYIKKFLASRWREGDELTYDECFDIIIVQEYIKQVDKLTDNESSTINKYSVGCGGTNNESTNS